MSTGIRRRLAVLLVALAAMVGASMVVGVPAASAADRIANPSGEWTVGCSGAWADVQVEWKSDAVVSISWQMKDTMTDGHSPVLRIWAQDAVANSDQYVFRDGKTHYVLSGGAGANINGSKLNWNPAGMDRINHLWIEVKAGTADQGVKCLQQKETFNWTGLGYSIAQEQQGKPYVFGAEGPNSFDCSGLVYYSYNRMVNFPDWSVRSSQQMYDWARTHTGQSKFYAKPVAFSDLKVGDLIFYNTLPGNANLIDHVAFYAGNGRIFDALQPGTTVGYHDDMTGSRVAAYRILGVQTL